MVISDVMLIKCELHNTLFYLNTYFNFIINHKKKNSPYIKPRRPRGGVDV
jgi:hypothetical protein